MSLIGETLFDLCGEHIQTEYQHIWETKTTLW